MLRQSPLKRKTPLQRKRPDPNSPAARAHAIVKAQNEAKKPKKVYGQKWGHCEECHRYEWLDPHHLYRRSDRPDLENDPKNIIYLCRACHTQATVSRSYEKSLQDRYYPHPSPFKSQNDL